MSKTTIIAGVLISLAIIVNTLTMVGLKKRNDGRIERLEQLLEEAVKDNERVRVESPYQLSQPLFFSDSLSGMEIEILDKFQEGVIRVTVTIPTSWDEEAQEPILEEFRFFCSSYSAQMSGEFRNWNPK